MAMVCCALVFFLVLPPNASERLLNLSTDQSEACRGLALDENSPRDQRTRHGSLQG